MKANPHKLTFWRCCKPWVWQCLQALDLAVLQATISSASVRARFGSAAGPGFGASVGARFGCAAGPSLGASVRHTLALCSRPTFRLCCRRTLRLCSRPTFRGLLSAARFGSAAGPPFRLCCRPHALAVLQAHVVGCAAGARFGCAAGPRLGGSAGPSFGATPGPCIEGLASPGACAVPAGDNLGPHCTPLWGAMGYDKDPTVEVQWGLHSGPHCLGAVGDNLGSDCAGCTRMPTGLPEPVRGGGLSGVGGGLSEGGSLVLVLGPRLI